MLHDHRTRHDPLSRSLIACALAIMVALHVVDVAGAQRLQLHRDTIAHDVESPLTESDLLCNLCEREVAPAILRTIHASEAHHDTAETIEQTILRIIEDTEAHVQRPKLHEWLKRLLETPETARSISAVQRLHHDHPDRDHLLERLVDHVVCACRAHTWDESRVFDDLLQQHSKLVLHEMRKYQERDGTLVRSAFENHNREETLRILEAQREEAARDAWLKQFEQSQTHYSSQNQQPKLTSAEEEADQMEQKSSGLLLDGPEGSNMIPEDASSDDYRLQQRYGDDPNDDGGVDEIELPSRARVAKSSPG